MHAISIKLNLSLMFVEKAVDGDDVPVQPKESLRKKDRRRVR